MENRAPRRATRDDWQTTPLPARRARLSWERTFSEVEYQRLSYGRIPREMEDRWFMYLEPHDELDGSERFDELLFHRSWTGYCVYAVHLCAEPHLEGARYRVTDVYGNREPRQYRSMSETSDLAILTEMLIDGLLLAKPPALDPRRAAAPPAQRPRRSCLTPVGRRASRTQQHAAGRI